MDYETITPEEFGKSLQGIGLNLLVRNTERSVSFLQNVMGFTAHRVSQDYAILRGSGGMLQLHSDATYHANPLLSLLPETPPRGAGAEFRLYQTDPDLAVAKANAFEGATILAPAADKPHGLREAYILCPDGYAWVPSRPL